MHQDCKDNNSSLAAGGLKGGRPTAQVFVMGLDALGGYVFARMAHNEGEYYVQKPNTATVTIKIQCTLLM